MRWLLEQASGLGDEQVVGHLFGGGTAGDTVAGLCELGDNRVGVIELQDDQDCQAQEWLLLPPTCVFVARDTNKHARHVTQAERHTTCILDAVASAGKGDSQPL